MLPCKVHEVPRVPRQLLRGISVVAIVVVAPSCARALGNLQWPSNVSNTLSERALLLQRQTMLCCKHCVLYTAAVVPSMARPQAHTHTAHSPTPMRTCTHVWTHAFEHFKAVRGNERTHALCQAAERASGRKLANRQHCCAAVLAIR